MPHLLIPVAPRYPAPGILGRPLPIAPRHRRARWVDGVHDPDRTVIGEIHGLPIEAPPGAVENVRGAMNHVPAEADEAAGERIERARPASEQPHGPGRSAQQGKEPMIGVIGLGLGRVGGSLGQDRREGGPIGCVLETARDDALRRVEGIMVRDDGDGPKILCLRPRTY